MNIQVNRVANKFKEIFKNKIDMSDANDENIENYEICFLSRALALYSIMINTNSSVEEIKKCVIDGYHDCGIDAIYCDDSIKKMFLVQSKWSQEGKHSISQGDTAKFLTGIKKILNGDFDGFNEKIKPLKKSIENAIYSTDYTIEIIIAYTSNHTFSEECKIIMEQFIDEANDGMGIIFYKTIKLCNIYESLANANNLLINLDDFEIHDWGILEKAGKEIGYYGKLSISVIADWWKQHGTMLLSKNIRYYKGDTEVNNGIKDVLKYEPENFLLYNNGIKIIAEKIKKAPLGSNGRKIGAFSLENASIVNGAQTTGTIGEIYDFLNEQRDEAFAFVQIIILDGLSPELNEKITKYSNTQNRIDNKDFVSLDPFQQKLQQDFSMEGIDYHYKSGYIIKDSDKNCSVDDVAIAIGCGLDDVSITATIKSNYGKIFEKIDKAPYKLIFNDSFTTYYFWNSIQIYRTFEEINNSYQKKNIGTNKLISIHGNRFLLHCYLMIFQKIYDLKISILSNDEIDEVHKIIFQSLQEIICEIINIKNQLFPEAYPANMFKNGKRCIQIYDELIKTQTMQSRLNQGLCLK